MHPFDLFVYPNPTHGKLFITNPSQEMQEITIFASIGKQLCSHISGDAVISFDISGQASGMYFARITNKTNQQIRIIKFILN
jgi:hypothetical protein